MIERAHGDGVNMGVGDQERREVDWPVEVGEDVVKDLDGKA